MEFRLAVVCMLAVIIRGFYLTCKTDKVYEILGWIRKLISYLFYPTWAVTCVIFIGCI